MLFNAPLIPGLAMRDDLISPDEEAALIAAIDAVELAPFRFQGFIGKRLTRSFGWQYDFDRASFTPTEPIPDWLLTARNRAAQFAGIDPDDLAQILLIRYDEGTGIGWHRDRSVFGEIVGLSLDADTILNFRQRTATGFRWVKLPLHRRSAYHLNGEARTGWEHGIASHPARRYSITFRTLRVEA